MDVEVARNSTALRENQIADAWSSARRSVSGLLDVKASQGRPAPLFTALPSALVGCRVFNEHEHVAFLWATFRPQRPFSVVCRPRCSGCWADLAWCAALLGRGRLCHEVLTIALCASGSVHMHCAYLRRQASKSAEADEDASLSVTVPKRTLCRALGSAAVKCTSDQWVSAKPAFCQSIKSFTAWLSRVFFTLPISGRRFALGCLPPRLLALRVVIRDGRERFSQLGSPCLCVDWVATCPMTFGTTVRVWTCCVSSASLVARVELGEEA